MILNINSSILGIAKYSDEKGCPSFEGPTLEREMAKATDHGWEGWGGCSYRRRGGLREAFFQEGRRPELTKQRWEGRRFRQIVIVKSCPALCDPMDC